MSTGRGSMESRGLPLRSCRAPDVDSSRNWDGNFFKRQVRVGYGCYGVYQVYIINQVYMFFGFFPQKRWLLVKITAIISNVCTLINFADFGWEVPSIAWWITMHGRSMKKPYGSQVTYLVLFLEQRYANSCRWTTCQCSHHASVGKWPKHCKESSLHRPISVWKAATWDTHDLPTPRPWRLGPPISSTGAEVGTGKWICGTLDLLDK